MTAHIRSLWVTAQLCCLGVGNERLATRTRGYSRTFGATVVGISSIKRIAELERMRTTAVPASFWDDLADLGTPPSTITD